MPNLPSQAGLPAPSFSGYGRHVRTGGARAAPCRKGTAVRMNLTSLPSLTAGGAGLSALLSGAPWWAVLLGAAIVALVPPVVTQARAWARDRAERAFQDSFIQTVNQLPDPEKRIQAMIEYRRSESPPNNAEATGQAPAASPPDSPADAQGP